MFAITKVGSKQYKIKEGDYISVEKVEGEVGSKIELPLLMLADGDRIELAARALGAHSATAEIVATGRARKVLTLKHKRRKNHRKKIGHRQHLTKLKIVSIDSVGSTQGG